MCLTLQTVACNIEAVHLTSFGGQTNHQCMTIVNIHHITFTHAPAVLMANFCCYHEHYHVGAQPLYSEYPVSNEVELTASKQYEHRFFLANNC